jgi:tellurite resistance protein TerC
MPDYSFIYMVFGLVAGASLLLDLLILNKKNEIISTRKALVQTFFWVAVSLGFFFFLLSRPEVSTDTALAYLSGYLMEWSLSVDNIFVFILIFSSFNVKDIYCGRVLLTGILMAILFRVVFITVGVALVDRFHWILYVFGVFLAYTGYKMFTSNEEEEFEPHDSVVYKFLKRFLTLTNDDGGGKYVIRSHHGRPVYTSLFVVVILLAAIDIIFALDSIPAVMGISQDRMVIYTSNIFAVMGLRSLFFFLRSAVSKFDFLQQGIAIVLIFIGLKMLAEHWISQWVSPKLQVVLSLGIIIICIVGSILYSSYHVKKGTPKDVVI